MTTLNTRNLHFLDDIQLEVTQKDEKKTYVDNRYGFGKDRLREELFESSFNKMADDMANTTVFQSSSEPTTNSTCLLEK